MGYFLGKVVFIEDADMVHVQLCVRVVLRRECDAEASHL